MTTHSAVRLVCRGQSIEFPTRADAVQALRWGDADIAGCDRVEVFNRVRSEWEWTTAEALIAAETPPQR